MIMTGVPLADVADAFRRAGLDTYYHENPHGDVEVHVNGAGDADCLLVPLRPGEYLVCDSGGERDTVEDMARTLSATLTGMGIRHELEVFDADHQVLLDLHFEFPVS